MNGTRWRCLQRLSAEHGVHGGVVGEHRQHRADRERLLDRGRAPRAARHQLITGGGATGNFNFNPGATAGKGDLINLSGDAGQATINAFSFGATRTANGV